ncbi:nitronate monooxygenase [Tropicimonas sp. TH_r6]|uniref:NAD(P)H-dependent flavin oxidoreductase n=1 Tax=Tropicimonas sp. TH_r6 TaxID=3082085 RepID=UPI002955AEFF|nr:nitronate monooxygenase [Tropicimonas sp. TH_r6]MDV7145739.1 nitronate monooxygenase [Tropicimonas sp. TH_r6]
MENEMWARNRICDLFSIDLPILQAPMAGSSGLDMALAVSAAGGLGALACASMDADDLSNALTAFRSKSDRPVNVNFFAHQAPAHDPRRDTEWLARLAGYYDELGLALPDSLRSSPVIGFDRSLCEVVEAFAPPVVSFHFGLPAQTLVSRVKAVGCRVISSATTVEEARWLEANGCDAIIAQGYEAGGHRGMFLSDDIATQIGTFSLVPQIADAVSVPVIAAGGIADGRGTAAAFVLGACAVQVGTAYLFTDEATISPIYRKVLSASAPNLTALSNVYSGRPARVLANRMVLELGPMSQDAPSFPNGFAASGPLRAACEDRESCASGAYYSGQSSFLCRRTTAFELTKSLAADARRQLVSCDAG